MKRLIVLILLCSFCFSAKAIKSAVDLKMESVEANAKYETQYTTISHYKQIAYERKLDKEKAEQKELILEILLILVLAL